MQIVIDLRMCLGLKLNCSRNFITPQVVMQGDVWSNRCPNRIGLDMHATFAANPSAWALGRGSLCGRTVCISGLNMSRISIVKQACHLN